MPGRFRLRDLIRQDERQHAKLVLIAASIGVLGAVGNLVFRTAIEGATWLFQGMAAPFGRPGIPLPLLAGGLALLVLDRLFPDEVLGYGFPRFLEMLHLQDGRVKRRWMVVKTLGAAVSLGAGAAVGREGPIAQIGGSIGAALAWLARLSTDQRKVLIACGAAAGIAATFNAPLGAILFAHEIVLLGEVPLANLSLIVVATVAGVITARGAFGSESAFHAAHFALRSYWECVTYAALGVVLGVLAVAYMRLFHWTAARLRRLPWPRAAVLLAGLALVGLLDVAVPGNVSDGYPLINDALAGRLAWTAMVPLALAKIVGSSLSLGCGAPGGVFGPIFFIGAMTGGSFRALSQAFLPGVTGPLGSYALVGLGGFLAATTHAPLTAIFLLFEMTQSYDVTVPALLTVGTALIVATRLEHESIDTLGLSAEGKSLHPSLERQLLDAIPVGSVYQRNVATIPENTPLPEILRRVGDSDRATFPVVDAKGDLTGTISFAALRAVLLEAHMGPLIVARDLADPHVATLTPDTTLAEASRRLESEGLEDVPVVDAENPKRLLGLLSRADLIAAFNRTVATLGSRPVSSWLVAAERRWSDDYRVVAVEVPPRWVGHSLRELDCRARFGVAVLAVHRSGRADQAYELPDPARPLAAGDRLVVAGTADAIRGAETG
jgi:chloride channel protein, CIC family